MFVSFLPTLGSPCSLPEHSQGKETVSAREWMIPQGRATGEEPPQGFLPGSPPGKSVVLRVLVLDV